MTAIAMSLNSNVGLKKCVRADQDVDLAVLKAGQYAVARLALLTAGQKRNPQTSRLGERSDCFEMLTGENFRRRHQCGLRASFDGNGHRQQRDDGFARSDVALQQAQHPV